MGQHTVIVEWNRGKAAFTDGKYNRGHTWRFDGGVEIPASASPHIVPSPYSVESAVDPEEAFVASLSSCHMLFFLSIAAKRGFRVESYRDEAIGILAKDANGSMTMTTVTLQPDVRFGGDNRPTAYDIDAMHHQSHDECFIARSVKTDVRCEPKVATV